MEWSYATIEFVAIRLMARSREFGDMECCETASFG